MSAEAGWSAQRVIGACRGRHSFQEPGRCVAWWLCVTASRDEVIRSASGVEGNIAVVPLKVERGFDSPNGLAGDVAALLETNRRRIEEIRLSGRSPLLLLLAKTRNQLPPISSLVTLPRWATGVEDMQMQVSIEDLADWETVPVDQLERSLIGLSPSLFRLESRFQAWLAASESRRERVLRALAPDARRPTSEVLERARTALSLRREDHLRLSAGNEAALLLDFVARRAKDTSPEAWRGFGAWLSNEELPSASVRGEISIAGLVLPGSKCSNAQHVSLELFASVHAAHRLLTVRHHFDQYPEVNVAALEAFVCDLRRSLERIADAFDP